MRREDPRGCGKQLPIGQDSRTNEAEGVRWHTRVLFSFYSRSACVLGPADPLSCHHACITMSDASLELGAYFDRNYITAIRKVINS